MFGHNDQQPHDDGNQPAPDGALDEQGAGTPQVNDTAGDYIEDDGPLSGPTVTQPTQPDDNAAADDNADTTDDAPTLPAPASDPLVAPAAVDDIATPTPASPPAASDDAAASTTPLDTDALLDIKQQALQQLTPLVGHLEQTPEEKFRTTMMMIQAADNHALIQTAYEAAGQIQDEKVRAQALLDIVNEINYFTHNGSEEQQAAAT